MWMAAVHLAPYRHWCFSRTRDYPAVIAVTTAAEWRESRTQAVIRPARRRRAPSFCWSTPIAIAAGPPPPYGGERHARFRGDAGRSGGAGTGDGERQAQ